MNALPVWRRSWLHPQALYLTEAWPGGGGQPPPAPDPRLLAGVRRCRAVLPVEAGPPPGWTCVRTTILRRVPAAALEAALAPPPRDVRLGLVSRSGHDWASSLALHERRYRATHRDNPPRPLVTRERALIFAGADLTLALGLRRGGRLVDFASLREGTRANVEVGWVGIEGCDPIRACGWLLRRCAQEGRRRGLRWLEVEIDSDDAQLAPLLRRLPAGQD